MHEADYLVCVVFLIYYSLGTPEGQSDTASHAIHVVARVRYSGKASRFCFTCDTCRVDGNKLLKYM
jgi:hypothetical protein